MDLRRVTALVLTVSFMATPTMQGQERDRIQSPAPTLQSDTGPVDANGKMCADYFTSRDPGKSGISADRAIAACKTARDGHDAVSLRILGIAYVTGKGLSANKVEGIRFLEAAMKGGSAYFPGCEHVDGPAMLYFATMLWQGEVRVDNDAPGPTIYFPKDPKAPESKAQALVRLSNARTEATCVSRSLNPQFAEMGRRLQVEISKSPLPKFTASEWDDYRNGHSTAGKDGNDAVAVAILGAMLLGIGLAAGGNGSTQQTWECHAGTPNPYAGEVTGFGGNACGWK